MKRYTGPVLSLSGLLLLLTCAAKPPGTPGTWPDTLPCALGGGGLAVLGVFLWRRQPDPVWGDLLPGNTAEGQVLGNDALLAPCVEALQGLHARLATGTMAEIFSELETIYTAHILPLSLTHRQVMVGLDRGRGLEALTLFSQGELWVNRARSAAGDHHREETRASLAWALESFLAVQRLRAAARDGAAG